MLNKPTDLLCEYFKNPLAVDTLEPGFSWRMENDKRNNYQTAYRILVASSQEELHIDSADMWDSGRVESGQSVNVKYNGFPLEKGKQYFWKVKIWDNEGKESEFSDIATFEVAPYIGDEWAAKWIGAPSIEGTPVMFRKTFDVEKKVTRARVHISALGYYELSINGCKVGDHVLDPGCTDYRKTVLYTTYAVDDFLKQGSNAIGVIVARGHITKAWTVKIGEANDEVILEKVWEYEPQFIMEMRIEFDDGTEMTIVTDENSGWIYTKQGPIRYADIYNGETYDARFEIPGWDEPDYDISKQSTYWEEAIVKQSPTGSLIPQTLEPIKVVGDILPIEIRNPKPGVYVCDFGQNFAGWAKLQVKGEAGTEVVMKFAEVLYGDGTINQKNLRGALATDRYILKGSEEEETYEPRFTYHGFRYAQIEGLPGVPTGDNIIGRVVRSAVPVRGTFECGNPLINKIHRNIVWTEGSNLHSIPTDCPQRDERFGWLNDLTSRAEEAIYNFDLVKFFAKWIRDISDTQDPGTGTITDTAPFVVGGRPADPVSTCYLLVPWLIYLHYGNKRIIEENYEGMKKWVDFLFSQTKDNILSYSYYGDWASPIEQCVGGFAISRITPGELMSTGYLYYNCVLMERMAEVLGKADESKTYRELAEKVKDAFNDEFFNKEFGWYAKGSQASNVFPLFLGIVPEEEREKVIANLVEDVMEKNDGHLTTGNQCTKYLIEVLLETGNEDVALALLTQTTYPSWGYMIENGATTVWERWENLSGGGMNSHNHPMHGAMGASFYKQLGGIKPDSDGPGFARFSIAPCLTSELGFVNCSVETVRGTIISSWKKTEWGYELDVKIPWNSEGEIRLPIAENNQDAVTVLESDKTIWKGGERVDSSPGIVGIRRQGQDLVISAGSGEYSFKYYI